MRHELELGSSGAGLCLDSAMRRHDLARRIVEGAVAVVFFIDQRQIDGASRGEARVAHARQVSMYLLHCAFQLPHAQIGRIYNRDRTTVRHACAIIEDRRDEPTFDRTMCNLEEIVCRLGIMSGLPCRDER